LVALVGENEQDLGRRFEEWRRQAPWLVEDDSPADVAGYGLVGTPQQVMERVEEFRTLGVTDLVLSFSPLMFGWCSAAGWDIVAEELLL
jgi:alkanesulfonate monooxygenase SsuD/methylene tetrahydromethanopterin reductase-like flavin-dependent oxidoreductase (luciferase family)